ncbi:type II toxin-antitoxin system RelE/ParE family toxin [Marinimicrobium sp. C2-29]|uniref:type II toxin-antitoxin system RelE/ParE family toxin n=1 Tax=Marinimicrobium sp. C2-29 TaxID=3139825 RepID=UPI003139F26B
MSSKNVKAVNVTPRAKTDLRDIWLYGTETWGEDQADKYFYTLFEAMEGLALEPGKGRARPELLPQCSSYICGNHIIYYRERSDAVEILGVLHQRMDAFSQLTKL